MAYSGPGLSSSVSFKPKKPSQSAFSSWSPSTTPNAGTVGGGIGIFVDFSPVIADIKRVLSTASAEIQKMATYNALNAVCGPALTRVRREIAKETSAPYGRVMSRVYGEKAHPNKLSYVIHAEDTAMPLKDFMKGGKAGAKRATFVVWGKQRTITKNIFLVDFGRGPAPVKRVAIHKRNRSGKLGAKALYGPIIPREMIRPNNPSMVYLQTIVPLLLLPRLEHEIAQAFGRAAKASGQFVGPMRNRGVDKKFFSGYQAK